MAEARDLITRHGKHLDLTARAAVLRRTRRIALGGDDAPERLTILTGNAPATWAGEIDRLTGDDDWMMALKDLKQLGVIETRGKGRGSEYLLKRDRGPEARVFGAPIDSALAGRTD